MKRFYKGNRVLLQGASNRYKINTPQNIDSKALNVTREGVMIFKCDVNQGEHTAILNLNNVEVLAENLIDEVKAVFGNLYADEEIIEWRDR